MNTKTAYASVMHEPEAQPHHFIEADIQVKIEGVTFDEITGLFTIKGARFRQFQMSVVLEALGYSQQEQRNNYELESLGERIAEMVQTYELSKMLAKRISFADRAIEQR